MSLQQLSDNEIRESSPHELRAQERLSPEAIRAIATRINEKINIPILPEKAEQVVIVKVVRKIDRFLYEKLPNEIYDLITTANEGIDDTMAATLLDRLSGLINRHVDIPFVSEETENEIFDLVLKTIIEAMKTGAHIEQ